jgi:Domain of unknown function (DUF4216)
MSVSQVDQFTNSEFPKWFRSYFLENPSDPNEVAWSLSYGAAMTVTRCNKYIINGYRFATVDANAGTLCCNYGVCCRGDQIDGVETDYYGKLVEIIQLSYQWDKVVTLFKCEWFDNSPRGTKVDKHGNIEIHWTRRYSVGYDPFILAQQAEQVYYTPYPTSRQGWTGVIKTKARNIIPKSKEQESNDSMAEPFQADVEHVLPINIFDDEVPSNLFDSRAELELIPIQIDDEKSDDEDEAEMSFSDSESEFDDYESSDEDMQVDVDEQKSSG